MKTNPIASSFVSLTITKLYHLLSEAIHTNLKHMSNISDAGYLGIYTPVGIMLTLLRVPSINSYATLITLFVNVVDENLTNQE